MSNDNDIRPVAGQVYDETEGWVPTAADYQPVDTQYALDGTVWVEAEPVHHCPDGVCADLAAAFNLDEQAADWRSYEAWARGEKEDIHRDKAARAKQVKAMRRRYAESAEAS